MTGWIRIFSMLAAATTLAMIGCDKATMSTSQPTKIVEPESLILRGRSVMVVVDAPEKIRFDAPEICPILAGKISDTLERNVGSYGLENTTIADYKNAIVMKLRDATWRNNHPGKLAKSLNVDRILLVNLHEIDTIDKNSHSLLRTTMIADASVYAIENDTPIWTSGKIEIVIPDKDKPPLPNTPQNLNASTSQAEELLIDGICGKFYRHKEFARQ